MPSLECPLGAKCTLGPDGSVWRTLDLPYEQAKEQKADHVKFAHHDGDGASGSGSFAQHQEDPVRSNNLNVNKNKGLQGGNFVNSSLNHPTFNI